MRATWDETVRQLEPVLSTSELRVLVAGLEPASVEREILVLEATDVVVANRVRQQYQRALDAAVEHATNGRVTRVEVRLRLPEQQELFARGLPAPDVERMPERGASSSKALRSYATLLPRYTFETFIVGGSNQFAHAASRAVANRPGRHYNPLFIYGGVGLGKTHLVNAIGHAIRDRDRDTEIAYLSAEQFMTELISAIRRDRTDSFKRRFRQLDVLILDDVQFLSGRERTQEEFFHTFNSLYESHRQIVLTSDKFPKEIPDLEERLRNRFEWGLIADIQAPDVETRVAIVEKKAEMEKIDLAPDVALFLAENFDSNVRELEGSLTRLEAFASLNKCPITVDFARHVLGDVIRDPSRGVVSIETIQRAVSDVYHLRANELRSKRRTRELALARQVAMYLCRQYTGASFPVIGDRFGGRDHSTVIHAAQVIEKKLGEDEELRQTVARLRAMIERSAAA